ncbi:MAG: YjbQ family protein [Desulfarculus sp.]|nr:YjbQ family protein [Desulfarculus sp.]
MACHVHNLELPGSSGTDIHDVTSQVLAAVGQSGVRAGLVTVHTPGSTAAVTTIEHEPGVLEDLRAALERLAPQGAHYAHNARWGDGNGYAHVRAALLGPSLSLPIENGRPLLGQWQQVVVLDLDNRPRRRRVVIQVLGEQCRGD